MKKTTCKKCGWVHFAVTRIEAQAQVDSFNNYFDSLPTIAQRVHYSGERSHISQQERCFYCGNSYKNFRRYLKGDCPDGCTIQGIIQKSD